ncbi:Hypothetical protein CINCED_3A022693 [Cinara cedri]|uniref:Uncharacterized protein n=1 Tax=Cinara cedri TaxID=506608 RepID=A0A5E4MBA1_9HEMI|nr:Hypothetical protein CINCED_3A022693 [Cinara cedri]
MVENEGILHPFIQFKLIAPDTVKKCLSIKNEEKLGQIIFLDKYSSRDFSNVVNIFLTMETTDLKKMEANKNLNNLNIFFEKNKHVKETHNRTLAVMNSRLNKKKF